MPSLIVVRLLQIFLTCSAEANKLYCLFDSQSQELSCCLALDCLKYAQLTPGYISDIAKLHMSRGFVLVEFHKFTDLVCGKVSTDFFILQFFLHLLDVVMINCKT